jgi:predicted PurR-regulated permease PerM
VHVLSPVLIPLFLAFLVAYLLDPVVDFFERRNISRMRTIAGLAIIGILIVVLVPPFIISTIASEANNLVEAAGEWATSASDGWFRQQLSRLPFDSLASAMGWEAQSPDEDAIAVVARESAAYVRENAFDFLRTNSDTIAQVGQYTSVTLTGIFGYVADTFVGLILFLSNLALFAFVAIYLLRDYDKIVAAARDLLPRKYEPKISDIMGKIHMQVQNFMQGTFVVGLCLGGMYAVGFLVSGVPFALLIAAFGALAAFVPFVGVLLTALMAIMLTLLEHQFDWHIIGVLITIGVAQALEGNVLTPNIVGDKVGLGPVWVILAVMVFGTYFGFIGVLMAVPLAACLKVLVVEALEYYRASSLFTGESNDEPVLDDASD